MVLIEIDVKINGEQKIHRGAVFDENIGFDKWANLIKITNNIIFDIENILEPTPEQKEDKQ